MNVHRRLCNRLVASLFALLCATNVARAEPRSSEPKQSTDHSALQQTSLCAMELPEWLKRSMCSASKSTTISTSIWDQMAQQFRGALAGFGAVGAVKSRTKKQLPLCVSRLLPKWLVEPMCKITPRLTTKASTRSDQEKT
jgi:hypothetical protein